jgi:GTP-binding protein Era
VRQLVADGASGFRCGHVAIVGRPSVGKSTLLNALVGVRISITSKKPQTTRFRIVGILTDASAQFVFVDTPGFQTLHRSAMNDRLNRTVRETLESVDAALWVVDATRLTAADRAVAELIPPQVAAVVALNKIDIVADKAALLPLMADVAALRDFEAIVPVSADRSEGLAALKTALAALLPEGPPLYPTDEVTDRDERFLAAEFVREKIFRQLGDEVPYATTVAIDKFEHEGEMRRIHATVLVDKAGQRAILLGEGGARMKAIASQARTDMERVFGGRVFLEVWVKVKRGWADDARELARFGR